MYLYLISTIIRRFMDCFDYKLKIEIDIFIFNLDANFDLIYLV